MVAYFSKLPLVPTRKFVHSPAGGAPHNPSNFSPESKTCSAKISTITYPDLLICLGHVKQDMLNEDVSSNLNPQIGTARAMYTEFFRVQLWIEEILRQPVCPLLQSFLHLRKSRCSVQRDTYIHIHTHISICVSGFIGFEESMGQKMRVSGTKTTGVMASGT